MVQRAFHLQFLDRSWPFELLKILCKLPKKHCVVDCWLVVHSNKNSASHPLQKWSKKHYIFNFGLFGQFLAIWPLENPIQTPKKHCVVDWWHVVHCEKSSASHPLQKWSKRHFIFNFDLFGPFLAIWPLENPTQTPKKHCVVDCWHVVHCDKNSTFPPAA